MGIVTEVTVRLLRKPQGFQNGDGAVRFREPGIRRGIRCDCRRHDPRSFGDHGQERDYRRGARAVPGRLSGGQEAVL